MYSNTADFRTSVLEAYHEHGMRIFIEVGCCSHRTSSIETILAEYDDVVHVAMNRAHNLALPAESIKTLSGFKSRCTTFLL